MSTAEYWIEKLEMQPHPEGGYFKEVYRAVESHKAEHLPDRFGGDRPHSTSIYFLLKGSDKSKFHRIKSDEIWHFYDGASATIYRITAAGELIKHLVGRDFEKGESLQVMIPAGDWFAAEVNTENSFILCGCTVAPGFHFEDFKLAERDLLIGEYPQYSEIITRLT